LGVVAASPRAARPRPSRSLILELDELQKHFDDQRVMGRLVTTIEIKKSPSESEAAREAASDR
jgi:hypothetical protein